MDFLCFIHPYELGKFINDFLILGARGGTRTRTTLQSADFKSAVYTIPPPGLSWRLRRESNPRPFP